MKNIKNFRTFWFSAQIEFTKHPFLQFDEQGVFDFENYLSFDFIVSGMDKVYCGAIDYFNVEECVFSNVLSLATGEVSLKLETNINISQDQEFNFLKNICLFLNDNNKLIFYIDKNGIERYLFFRYIII